MAVFNAPVEWFWNRTTDSANEYYSKEIKYDYLTLNGSVAVLSQIPDETYGIEVHYRTSDDGEWMPMTQLKSNIKNIEKGQYKVDWTSGFLFFSGYDPKCSIRAHYYGRGFWLISDKRIMTNVSINPDGSYNYETLDEGLSYILNYKNRGVYNENATDYAIGNQVFYNGSTYIAIEKPNPGEAPIESEKWRMLAAGLNPRGEYNSATQYNPYDAVYYSIKDGTKTTSIDMYVCVSSCKSVIPTNTQNWVKIFSASSIVQTVNDIDDKKADKVTNDGFVAGKNATNVSGGVAIGNYAKTTGAGAAIGSEAEADSGFSGGYHAKGTGMGAAVGNSASAFHGGAVGYAANASTGGAVGENAHAAEGGGAVGENANTEGGGGAVGYNSRSSYGGAMGEDASSFDGAAVGQSAKTGDGVAVGKEAKTIDSSNNGIDAIQLGTGTNNTAKTMQVYDKRIVEADGSLTDVGSLEDLNTTNKSSIVGAINSVLSFATSGVDEDELLAALSIEFFNPNAYSIGLANLTKTGNKTYKADVTLSGAYIDNKIMNESKDYGMNKTYKDFHFSVNDLDRCGLWIDIDMLQNRSEVCQLFEFDLGDGSEPAEGYLDAGQYFQFHLCDFEIYDGDTDNPNYTVYNGYTSGVINMFEVVGGYLNSKAEIDHASSYTGYGLGDDVNYGHVKLSDSTSSTSGTSDGTAATPAAVKAAYDLANSKAGKENDSGGFMGGRSANVIDYGGAIGAYSYTESGGAVGDTAKSSTGGAVGEVAESTGGAAVGYATITSNGVAVGMNATTVDSDGNGIDAIQLGTGTNSTEKTMQVYNKRIVEANGSLTDVGDLAALATSNKTNVVDAINSIVNSMETPKSSVTFDGTISYSEQFSINLTGGFWVVGLNIPAITITDDFFGTFTIPAMTGVEFADSEHGGRCYVKYTFSVNDPSGTLSAQDVTNTAVLKEFKGKTNNYIEIEDGCVVAGVYVYVGDVTVSTQQNNDNQTEYYGSFNPISNASAPLLKVFYKSS